MADPRWTDEAHALAVAIHDASCHDRTCPATVIAAVYGKAALAALEHLAPRLLPPGGQTRTDWAYGYPDVGPSMIWQAESEGAARTMADLLANEDDTVVVLSRTAHEGPWLPAPTQEETPT